MLDMVEFMDIFSALSAPEDKKNAVQQRVSLTADILMVCELCNFDLLIYSSSSHSIRASVKYG
jgi:hypothetical protein